MRGKRGGKLLALSILQNQFVSGLVNHPVVAEQLDENRVSRIARDDVWDIQVQLLELVEQVENAILRQRIHSIGKRRERIIAIFHTHA